MPLTVGREGKDMAERKRKKKRKQSTRVVVLLVAGGAALAVLLCGGVGLSFWLYPRLTAGGPSATAVSSYATYQAPEDAFGCDYPSGWAVQREGVKDHYEVTFSKGAASISISQSIAGSALGDIAGAGGDPGNDPERAPVARVHAFKQAQAAEKLSGYQEEAAVTVPSRFGTARRSAFTARGLLGRKLRGYRATALGPMIQYDIICQCPAADLEVLEPAFARVIQSLGP
jgi:hypothetical protein